MSLKDLTIDQDAIQEQIIEGLVAPYIKYDINQKVVVFVPEKMKEITIPQRIVVYLLALRGWKYVVESLSIPQEAQPKDIAEATMENGSTTRTNLQILLKKRLIQKNSMKYSISLSATMMVQNYLKGNG